MKALIVFLAILAGCSHEAPNHQSTELVYIHGSHFDGSSWDEVRKITDTKFRSVAPNTGEKGLHEAARFYCDQISRKAVLVAHSYGGAIANQMTTTCADKVAGIIYVAAVSPHNNEMSFDLLSVNDQNSYSSIVDFGEAMVTPKEKKRFLEVMTSEKAFNRNIAIHPEPVSLGSEKLTIDESHFAKVPKGYVFTVRDSIIELASQKKYASRDNISKTRSLNSGHLPMITNPKELAQYILELQ